MSFADKLSQYPVIQQGVGLLTVVSNTGKLCLDVLKTINNIGVSILKPFIERYHYSKELIHYHDSIENADIHETKKTNIPTNLITEKTAKEVDSQDSTQNIIEMNFYPPEFEKPHHPPLQNGDKDNDLEEIVVSDSVRIRQKKTTEREKNFQISDKPPIGNAEPVHVSEAKEGIESLESVNVRDSLNQAKKNRPWHLRSNLQGDDQVYLMAREAGDKFKSTYGSKTDFKKHFESIGIGFLRMVPGIGSYYSYNRCKKIDLGN